MLSTAFQSSANEREQCLRKGGDDAGKACVGGAWLPPELGRSLVKLLMMPLKMKMKRRTRRRKRKRKRKKKKRRRRRRRR